MNVYLPFTARLPSAYQEVEYIESTGTQVLRIGSSWNNQYKTIIDYKFSNVPEDACLFGIRTSNYMRYYFGINQGAWRTCTGSTQLTSVGTANTNRHTATITYGNLNIDGTSYTINSGGGSYSRGICLFGYSSDADNNYYGFASAKVYSLKAYNGTTLLYDLVPCYRKSDNVIGLYDLVNSVFYTNSGTGTFSKGNDVTMAELKNAYIGEYVEQTYTIAKGGNVNIAKSGYKIKQIKTSYTSSASASNQYMSASVLLEDVNIGTANYEIAIPYTYLSYNISVNNKLLNCYCNYNRNQTAEYASRAQTPVTGPFALEFTTTTDNVQCLCNGSSILNQTATTKWKQTAEYLFGLSNLYVHYYLGGATSYYTGSDNATVTVTYEKI